jgi:outer membrane receptor protein involved in Fe transport
LVCNDDVVGSHCNPVDNLAEFALLTGNSATRVGNLIADYFPNNSTTGQAQLFPLSGFNPGGIALLPSTPGASGAGIRSFVTGNSADDEETFHGRETSVEWRFTSNLSGPFNFTAGAFYYDRRNYNEPYRVTFNGGDYWSLFEGAAFLGAAPGAQPYVGTDPYYYQDVSTTSSSKAVYFDGTYNLSDELVLKGGLRWQEDRDHLVNDHLSFTALNSPANCPPFEIGGAFCNVEASSTASAVIPTATAYEQVGVDTKPDTTDRVNGRAVLQWSPKLDFTDQSMFYISYSRGSKAGNVNLVSGVAAAEGVPTTFKPEDLTSYEIGTKNTLFDGTLQANLTAWYYQYENFQYTVVQFSTLFTSNFNAHMFGEEGEFIWQPTEDFTMNLNVTNSSSSIAGGQFAADARNPTAGVANAVLIKDDTLSGTDFPGGNCVILEHSGEDPASDPEVTAFFGASGLPNAFTAPVAAVGGPTALAGVGIAFANFGTCSQNMTALNAFLDTAHGTPGKVYYEYTNSTNAGPGSSVSGIAVPLAGKQVLNLPSNTVSVGAQYTFHLDEFSLVPRVDYYWTSSYFSRIFNDSTDKVPSWDQWNASIQLNAPDSRWYAKVYATNIGGKRNPEGFAPQSDTSGVPTYVATEDPRIVGFTIGARY